MITIKELEHLSTLARIELSDDDKTSLINEFDAILGYVDQLNKVKVPDDTSARIGSVKNVTRPDIAEVLEDSDRQRLLDEVPDREGDFVAVKNMFSK